jgi:hypothetical protein
MGLEKIHLLLPGSEARRVFDSVSQNIAVSGIVPDISSLCVVSDPENVLSPDEMRVIDTGVEDQRLKATFDIMPDPLRFALRRGYTLELSTKDEREGYIRAQIPLMQRASYLLGLRLQRAPGNVEIADDYCMSESSLFNNIRYLFLHPNKAIKLCDVIEIPNRDTIRQLLYLRAA